MKPRKRVKKRTPKEGRKSKKKVKTSRLKPTYAKTWTQL